MKGGGRVRLSSSSKKTDDTTGKALLGGAAAGAVANTTGAITPVITSCPPDDKTFMCKLTRFYNSFKMILGIITTVIGIGVLIWLAWSYWKSTRGSVGSKKGGGCGCSGASPSWR